MSVVFNKICANVSFFNSTVDFIFMKIYLFIFKIYKLIYIKIRILIIFNFILKFKNKNIFKSFNLLQK